MDENSIDAIAADHHRVSDLVKYFQLKSHSSLYNRLEKLGIVPTKVGRASYVSDADMKRLINLDIHLQDGGTFESFENSFPLAARPEGAIAKAQKVDGASALAMALMQLIHPDQPEDILQPQKTLAEAADLEVLLTSKQLRAILDKRSLIQSRYKAYGFMIMRRYYDWKRFEWSVSRLQDSDYPSVANKN